MIHALQVLLLLSFPALLIVGGLGDAVSYRIPNWVSLALGAGFLLAALVYSLPLAAFGQHLGVGAATLAVGMGMFAAGWLGGGDVKLLAASALWLSWPGTLTLMIVTGLTGGALSVGLLFIRSSAIRPLILQGPPWFARLTTEGESVPYGLAIAVGALAAFANAPLTTAVLAR